MRKNEKKDSQGIKQMRKTHKSRKKGKRKTHNEKK